MGLKMYKECLAFMDKYPELYELASSMSFWCYTRALIRHIEDKRDRYSDPENPKFIAFAEALGA